LAWLEARGTVLLGERAVKVLNDLYTEAAWLGACVARAQVGDLRKAATLKVDWDGWKPGDIDAANLLVADLDSNGLRELQARSGFVMRSINETRMTELSNALSNAVGQGLSQSATAALIKDKIGGASRWANVVANTETRRAVTAATLDTYAVAGIGMKEWATAGNAVDECKDFEDDGPIPLDGMWGDVSGPPAHPNCLCVVMPVLGEATPVTPGEGPEEVTEDVEIVTEAESVPVAPVTVDANGFYDRDSWPVWAKESGIADVIDELPVDRTLIGLRRQTKAELVLEWEKRAAYQFDVVGVRAAGAKAKRALPKLEDKYYELLDEKDLWLETNRGVLTLAQERQYASIERRVNAASVKLDEARQKIRENENLETWLESVRLVYPDWESGLVAELVSDLDPVTGKPGKTLLKHSKAIKRIGDLIEEEAQRRIPESLRGLPSNVLTVDELAILREARISVVSEIRPMDTGEKMFNYLDDAQAQAAGVDEHGPFRGADDTLRAATRPALDFYPSAWIDAMQKRNPKVDIFNAGRGYNQNGRIIAISGGNDEDIISTFVHEMGHSAERSVSGLSRLEWAELYERSVLPDGTLPDLANIYPGNDKEKWLEGSRVSDPYTAKLYFDPRQMGASFSFLAGGESFELFTTGMQASFPRTKHDALFADSNGALERFIIGLLAGL
jgi:hypothetical protein